MKKLYEMMKKPMKPFLKKNLLQGKLDLYTMLKKIKY